MKKITNVKELLTFFGASTLMGLGRMFAKADSLNREPLWTTIIVDGKEQQPSETVECNQDHYEGCLGIAVGAVVEGRDQSLEPCHFLFPIDTDLMSQRLRQLREAAEQVADRPPLAYAPRASEPSTEDKMLLALFNEWDSFSDNEYVGGGGNSPVVQMNAIRNVLVSKGMLPRKATANQIDLESSTDSIIGSLTNDDAFPDIEGSEAYTKLMQAWSDCQSEIGERYDLFD